MKKKWILCFVLMLIIFICYCLSILKDNGIISDIIMLSGMLVISVVLVSSARKTVLFKTSMQMLSAATIVYGLTDLLWLIFKYFLLIEPESMDLFYPLYLLPNIFILLSTVFYVKVKLHKWSLNQLVLDLAVVCFVVLQSVWFLFFKNWDFWSGESLFVNINNFLYLFTDICTFCLILALVLSFRAWKNLFVQFAVITGIIIYGVSDFSYSVLVYNDQYVSGGLNDAMFFMAFIFFGLAGIYTHVKSIDQYEDEQVQGQEIPENSKPSYKIYYFLFAPVLLLSFNISQWQDLLLVIAIFAIHRFTSSYLRIYYNRERMLIKEKQMNDLLEERIATRTEDLMKLNKELELSIRTDATTGLNNRSYFLEALNSLLEKASERKPVTLFFMDLDRFKAINDSYGHEIGDLILIEIAKRFNYWLKPGMLLARVGGDEFALVIHERTKPYQLEEIAEKLIRMCSVPIEINLYCFRLSVSIGIASYPTDANDRSTLMRNADIAMYLAKTKETSRFEMFNSRLSDKARRRHEIELLLNNADYDQEFELYFQPQFIIPEKKLVGMEALLRWKSPSNGMISPAEFIPVAEETAKIVPIGEWVIHKALERILDWNTRYKSNLRMGINISPKQFDSNNFMKCFKTWKENENASPEWVDIEITETCAMLSESGMEENFSILSDLGFSISIDDFGTGYSSLSYIKRFDIDALKIAKPLIDNISEDDDLQIVQAIIAMAKTMKVRTIAEGVETIDQFERLCDVGCNEIQGYYLGRPCPANEFEEKFLRIEMEDFKDSAANSNTMRENRRILRQ
jgi:diguanylate cyclase (GGDEF)-like protein